MRKTRRVSSDPSDPSADDAMSPDPDPLGAEAPATAERPESVGENDIAWPIPEAAMWPLAAVFAGLMVWAFGIDWVLASTVPLAVLLAVITVIDLRELRIPNKLTRPGTLLAIPLLALSLLSDWSDLSLLRALIAGLALGAVYFMIFFIYPPGMGLGDVKLAPILGAQLGLFGWIAVVRAVLLAHLIAGPVAILLMIFGRARRGTGFPFGPFLVAGTLIALVLEGRGI